MKTPYRALLPMVVLLATPMVAQAHPGHPPYNFVGGFLHPFTGVDYLLAMLAVGLWAACQGGRALWSMPLVSSSAYAPSQPASYCGWQGPRSPAPECGC